MRKPKNIDNYISEFPKETQAILKKIRTIVNDVIKGGEETISYGMPTIKLNGKNVVHFGFYPTPSGLDKFEQ